MAVLEQSRQELVAAMQQRRHERPLLGRLVVIAPRARILDVRKQLYDMVKTFQQDVGRLGDADPDAVERWALTVTFAPVSPKSRRK
jgi:hypothetical protein